MNPTKIVFLVIFIFSSIFCARAQNLIKGKVLVYESIPVINATVTVLNSDETVATNDYGEFEITCELKDKIQITANGFGKKKVKIKNLKKKIIYLNLSKDSKAAEIAISHRHILNIEEFSKLVEKEANKSDFSTYSDAIQILESKYSNVQVLGDGIIIRGKKSLQGSSYALIEIDGVTVGYDALAAVPTATIQSIKILTSSNAGMYGSRGANGVVIVKTKKAEHN